MKMLKSLFAPEKSNSEAIRAKAKCLVITNAKLDEKNYLFLILMAVLCVFDIVCLHHRVSGA